MGSFEATPGQVEVLEQAFVSQVVGVGLGIQQKQVTPQTGLSLQMVGKKEGDCQSLVLSETKPRDSQVLRMAVDMVSDQMASQLTQKEVHNPNHQQC